MNRLVQLTRAGNCAVALVEEPRLQLLSGVTSIFDLGQQALSSNLSLGTLIEEKATGGSLDYEPIYSGKSDWRLLPPIHHPADPSRCLVSGTGLTHLGSAKSREAMHGAKEAELNDSMKMFKWGVEAGKPAPGQIGIAPEWFYKGSGTILRAHNEPLDVPPFAEDGGEEGEIAGIYLISEDGKPVRIGMAAGNEFADHKFEKRNYLNLAGSKLRQCSLGPELVVNPAFDSIPGNVKIERAGKTLWSQEILTGGNEMCHSLANIEHHHFKFEGHRRPGDLHVHYFGACILSFGAGIELANGDVMEISFSGFGRPLRNPVRILGGNKSVTPVRALS